MKLMWSYIFSFICTCLNLRDNFFIARDWDMFIIILGTILGSNNNKYRGIYILHYCQSIEF